MESDISQEFFDATDGGAASPLLTLQDSDGEDAADAAENLEDDAPSDSEDETEAATPHDTSSASPLWPARPKSLTPLPLDKVRRRQNIAAPTVLPPSLIGFLRKNVGKDLSFVPLRPEQVVEVRYDYMEGVRFRHTAQFVRWRPDRDPESCTYDQLDRPVRFNLADVLSSG